MTLTYKIIYISETIEFFFDFCSLKPFYSVKCVLSITYLNAEWFFNPVYLKDKFIHI